MKWLKLYTKLGRQNLSVTNNQEVYAVLDMNDGLGLRKVYLDLKFDKSGHPYLAQSGNKASKQDKPVETRQEQIALSASDNKASDNDKLNIEYTVDVIYHPDNGKVATHDDPNKVSNPSKSFKYEIRVGLKTGVAFYGVPELEYRTVYIDANSDKEAYERLYFLYGEHLDRYEILDEQPNF